MSSLGVVIALLSIVLGDLQNALWTIAGAVLSVVFATAVQISGKVEEIRDWRRDRKAKRRRMEKEKEALESETESLLEDLNKRPVPVEGVALGDELEPIYIPAQDDLPPVDEAPIMTGLRLLREGLALVFRGLKELVALGRLVSWVAITYLVLLAIALGLKSVMRRLGVPEETAEDALIADVALLILTGAWFLTGIRTKRRSIPFRSLETVVLDGIPMGSVALGVTSESVIYGVLCLSIGVLFYMRAFR